MRKEFAAELLKYALDNPLIQLVVGDLGYGVFEEFQQAVPMQYENFGVTEQSSVSVVAGMAKKGLRPFYYSIGNFPTLRALEQIRNDVCYMQLPATIVSVGVGFGYGTAGYSHHLIEDLSSLSSMDIDVYMPSMPNEVSMCLYEIIRRERPAYLRLGKGGEKNFSKEDGVYSYRADLSQCKPNTLVILVNGPVVEEAVMARKLFDKKFRDVIIVSCWSSNNLSEYLSDLLRAEAKFLVVEEHVTRGGFGSWIDEIFPKNAEKVEKISIEKVNRDFTGSSGYLRKKYQIDAEVILKTLQRL